MLSVGVDTHLEWHEITVLNEQMKVMWNGRILNNKKGFEELLEKLENLKKNNNDNNIVGIYLNPTANYHVPIEYYLKKNGYNVVQINPIVSKSVRNIQNLGKAKNDKIDAYTLATIPWINSKFQNKNGHERDAISELTRLHEKITTNITRLQNCIQADLACVFPEFLQ